MKTVHFKVDITLFEGEKCEYKPVVKVIKVFKRRYRNWPEM